MNAESPALPAPEGATRLADWGVIRASGAEARKFLHSQLTQDIEGLALGQARLAGYCSAKGRLMATFIVWRDDQTEADVLLACSADLLPTVLKRLSMFVLRAKCKLSDASAEVPLWGLAGAAAAAALGEAAKAAAWRCLAVQNGTALRLPDALHGDQAVQRWLFAGAVPPVLPELPATQWQGLEATSGVARVVAATTEQFVPQMVNLELVGGVNFQKGCYPGQEVVARSQYRGTLKRRAQVVSAAAALAPGQELFHSADPGQPAGMVVISGQLPGLGDVALAEMKLSALDGGQLHLGSAEGPGVLLRRLPYPIPAETA